MADIQAPSGVVNTQQVVAIDSFRERQLLELSLLKAMETSIDALESTPDGRGRGYEIR